MRKAQERLEVILSNHNSISRKDFKKLKIFEIIKCRDENNSSFVTDMMCFAVFVFVYIVWNNMNNLQVGNNVSFFMNLDVNSGMPIGVLFFLEFFQYESTLQIFSKKDNQISGCRCFSILSSENNKSTSSVGSSLYNI